MAKATRPRSPRQPPAGAREGAATQSEKERALAVALRYLGYRPRSVGEVRLRLLRSFPGAVADPVLRRLRELGLLDDARFASLWVESRMAHSPRSRYLLRRELRAKGVDAETIGRVLASADEEESAYHAGLRKAASLAAGDEREFREKLGAFLKRRGFSYDTIIGTVRRLWRERSGSR